MAVHLVLDNLEGGLVACGSTREISRRTLISHILTVIFQTGLCIAFEGGLVACGSTSDISRSHVSFPSYFRMVHLSNLEGGLVACGSTREINRRKRIFPIVFQTGPFIAFQTGSFRFSDWFIRRFC